MAVTKTFVKAETFTGLKASAHYAYTGTWNPISGDPSQQYGDAVYNIVPDGSVSGIVTLDLRELANVGEIVSCSLSRSISVSTPTAGGRTTQWVLVQDASGTGTIDQQILEYLQQTPRPTSISIRVLHSFVSQTYNFRCVKSDEWVLQGEDTDSYLTKATLTLSVIYDESSSTNTISYGTNNAWQKCNAYYGTNGSWQKCKAYFGSDGSWKETQ